MRTSARLWLSGPTICPVLMLAGMATGCCCSSPRPAAVSLANTRPVGDVAPAVSPPEQVLESSGDSTFAEMQHVDFHIAPGLALRIQELRGYMVSKTSGQPISFDDKQSFVLEIRRAEVGLNGSDLDHLMNDYVFNYRGAPLRNLRFTPAGDRLRQTGILHKVVDIPFEMLTQVEATPDGQLLLHPVSLKICGVDGKGLMEALGITLSNLLDLKHARGVRVRENDLLLDPDSLLPPPAIRGRVRAVRVTAGQVILTFDSDSGAAGVTAAPRPPAPDAPNFMFFYGGTLRFGKLFMVQADMQLVDADPSDPFDFNLDQYNEQLVAGRAEPQPDFGVLVIMPDWREVRSGVGPDTAAPPPRNR